MAVDRAPSHEDRPPGREPARSSGWRSHLELYATLVMAAAAILTAWSAFESAKWSGEQAMAFADAAAARVESTRASTLAGQQATVDVVTFTEWLAALRDDVLEEPDARARLEAEGYTPEPGLLSTFLYQRLRDEFRPAVDAWLAEDPAGNPDAPPTPFAMDEYDLAAQRESGELVEVAEGLSSDARVFNQRSDNYVLMTVAFATVLFFAGISTKLRQERNRLLAFSVSAAILVGAAAVLATLPVEI